MLDGQTDSTERHEGVSRDKRRKKTTTVTTTEYMTDGAEADKIIMYFILFILCLFSVFSLFPLCNFAFF